MGRKRKRLQIHKDYKRMKTLYTNSLNIENYLMRSLMFVPCHNTKLIESAMLSNADVLLLDIEDSVPLSEKQSARDKIEERVKTNSFNKNQLIFPRINDRESGQLLKDIYQLTLKGIDGFMYPKAKTGQDIYFFSKLLETIEYEKDFPIGTFKIIPLIETAAAVLNVQDIIQASRRVVSVAFGCEDFITDIDGIHDKEGESIFSPRAIIAIAAHANKVIPIDTVHIDIHNLKDLEKNLKIAKILGFKGMLVLHPKELSLVHRYFSPTKKEVKDAEEMLTLSIAATEAGKGVAVINDKFIGPPMKKKAEAILKKHNLVISKNKELM